MSAKGNATLDAYLKRGIEDELLERLSKGASIRLNAKSLKYMEACNETALEVAKALTEQGRNVIFVVPDRAMENRIRQEFAANAEVTTPTQLLRESVQNFKKIMTPQMSAYIAYKSMPQVKEPERTKQAKSMAAALELLYASGIDPLAASERAIYEKLEAISEQNKIYAEGTFKSKMSKEDIRAFAGLFIKFAKAYRDFKKDQGYIDMQDMAKAFDADIKQKYVFALGLSDFTPVQQQMIFRIKERGATVFMTTSDETLLGFIGADKELKSLGRDKIDYYLNTEEFRFDLDKGKARSTAETEILVVETGKQDLEKVASEIAAESEKPAGIIARFNYQVQNLSSILNQMRTPHTALARITTDDNALNDAVSFVEGLLCEDDDREKISKAIRSTLSPVPMRAWLNKTEKYLKGENVEEFSEFFNLRTGIKTKDDLAKTLRDRIRQSSGFATNISRIKTLEKVAEAIEAFPFFDRSNLSDVVAWLKVVDFSEPYEYRSDTGHASGITVATPYNRQLAKLVTIVFVAKEWQSSHTVAEAVADAIAQASGRRMLSPSFETELNSVSGKLDTNKGKLIVVTDNAASFGLKSAHRRTASASTPSPLKNRAFELPYEDISDVKAFVKNFFANLNTISFTLLSKINKPKELRDFILGISDRNEAMKLGSDVHKALEAMTRGEALTEEKQKEVGEYLKNARQIAQTLTEMGFAQIAAEERVETPLESVAGSLGLQKWADWKDVKALGVLDAVFENKQGEILILDYKTDMRKNEEIEQEHMEQLALYRQLYAAAHGVPAEKVKTAIAYIGLRGMFADPNETSYAFVEPQEAELAKARARVERHIERLHDLVTNPESMNRFIESAFET
ncbi:MAG: PD-(D/E)XK nuclease family protein [Candidatus Micrarchaeia archaeon]